MDEGIRPSTSYLKMVKRHISIFITLLSYISLFGQSDSTVYSFFVAGHTYGKPGVNNIGFHPPFKQKFTYIQSRPEIELGVLTGDIVAANPVSQDWDEIDAEIDTLGLPVYFAVGNHDMENRPIFESRYGSTYYQFVHQNDLFIVLDPNIDQWNISGYQLIFLRNTIKNYASNCDNIYVFFHEILWRDNDNEFNYISWNSSVGRASAINFWSEVEPLFHKLSNKVVMFAGDLGASWSSNVTYDSYDNMTLIASGMGDEDGENFIVVNVKDDKSLTYDLICLSDSNINCLGMLEDYQVVYEVSDSHIFPLKLYPNPTSDFLFIDLIDSGSYKIQFYNQQGVMLLDEEVHNKKGYTLNCKSLPKGVYILTVVGSDSELKQQVLID